MSLPYADPKWATGSPAIAAPVEMPRFSAPIPGVATEYILKQKWRQLRNAFSPLPMNTAHPDYATFALVEEGERVGVGAGQVEWERTYAKKPATHSEYETFLYGFPGTVDYTTTPGTTLLPRAQYNQLVTSRIQHDYFLIGTGGAGLVTPDYSTVDGIGKILAFRVVLDGTFSSATVGSWYALSPDNLVIKAGGDVANGLSYPETCPNLANYYAMVKDANTNGWGATVTAQPVTVDASTGYAYVVLASCTWGGQIVAENSRLTRWRGNYWLRTTRYVLAI